VRRWPARRPTCWAAYRCPRFVPGSTTASRKPRRPRDTSESRFGSITESTRARRRLAMPLMPKRVKFRKSQRGKIKGNATRGNTVTFGDYGLQSLDGGWLSAEAIEAGRITATHSIRGEGRLYIRVFPHKSV